MLQGACFDIDGTLATHRLGYHPVGYFEFVLAGLLCGKGKKPVESLEMVCRAEEEVLDYDPCLAAGKLGVGEADYREELRRYQEKYLDRHEDVLNLLKFFASEEIPVFVTTNNTETRARLVLEFLGCLPKVEKIFTPRRTGFRKSAPDFWRRVIEKTGIPGREMVVIGDDPLSDCEIPLRGGVGEAFLLPPFPGRADLPGDWLIRKTMDHKEWKGVR